MTPSRPIEILTAIRRRLPQTVIPREAWSEILPIASQMPPSDYTIQYLEFRLARDDHRIDYQIVGRLPGIVPVLETTARSPMWRGRRPGRISRFARRLRRDRNLRRFVPSTGLEFDLPGGAAALPLPQVGFCVSPRLFRDLHHDAPPARSRAFMDPVFRALSTLNGAALAPATVATLERCFLALPEGARVVHVAALVGRAGHVIRFIPQLPVNRVAPYLDRIGWRGDAAARKTVLELCPPVGNTIKIDVDVAAEGVLPKFAAFAEYTAGQFVRTRRTYATAAGFLDRLVRRGLCGARKRDALVRWPSMVSLRGRRGAWPMALGMHLDFKLIASPEGDLEGKGYLGLLPGISLF